MKVELREGAQITRPHRTDAGYDLSSLETVTIMPGECLLVKTGVHLEIPEGYFGLLTHRSSLPVKLKCQVMTGVIDSGYRGEVLINVHNMDPHGEATVVKDQRIAQVVIIPVYGGSAVIGTVTSDTPRGEGGFGSTDDLSGD